MYKHVHHITAGAGAGKTTELVNIITRLVNEENVDPQRMILTTYTDAAATEFREKSKAKLPPDKAVKMNGALMGTLHSIAGRYINRYWYLLGISPSVKPVSESVSEILMNRSLEDLVTGEQKALLNKYVETFGITSGSEGYDYDFWKKTLKGLFDKIRGYGFGKDRIPDFRQRTMVLLRGTFNQDRNKDMFLQAKSCLDQYLDYKDIVEEHATDAGKKQYGINCGQVKSILAIDPMTVKAEKLKAIKEMTWGRPITIAKKGPVKDRYDGEIADCKDMVAGAAEYLSKSLVPAEYTLVFDVAELLFDIIGDWIDSYDKIKKQNGVIDFADMEALFLRLLRNDYVLEDIRKSVDYLFVDEFQDSNPIQTEIYEILSKQIKQSWFVGDRKQAIYGFAGSDAGLVSELVKAFPQPEKDAASITKFRKDGNGNSSQVLDTSRRSVKKLVIAANDIFIPAFADTKGAAKDVIPEEHVRLKWDESKKDAGFYPLYHVCASKTVRGNLALDYDALAAFVCHLSDSDDFKAAGYTLSDIAILTRTGAQGSNVAKALVKKNISTSFVAPESFVDTPEVSLVLAILRLSAGIEMDKSRAEIRKLIQNEDLATLSAKVGKGENTLENISGLDAFAKAIRPLSVIDRINEIITRFDLYGICGHWGNPDARRGNLNLICNAAEVYLDKSKTLCSEADVRGFITFLEDFKPEVKFDNSAEGVKVLTYHKSKGLDWKIVILCGLDEYKEEDTISGVSVLGSSTHPDSILAIPRLPDKDWVMDCINNNPESLDILSLRRAVKRGEEKRLLYVGFTRAKDVVITASCDTSPEVLKTLCPTVSARTDTTPQGEYVDIWGIHGVLSRYCQMDDEPDLKLAEVRVPVKYKDAGFSLSIGDAEEKETPKYHSPSKYFDYAVQSSVVVETVKDFGARTDIPHSRLDDNVFGDCIHHIFARCVPGKHEANLTVAASTLKGYGIQDTYAPEKAVACIEAFFEWMEKAYGEATSLEHEVPFKYTDHKGRVFSGNMDLVWMTEKGCVLVDYKTFPGKRSDLFDKESDHWAGGYASQLGVYAEALTVSEWGAPLDRLLFYPVEGLVIRVK